MNNGNELHVVIGASGGIGSAVTRLLVERGKHVHAVNRSGKMDFPEVVELLAAEATNLEGAKQVPSRKSWPGRVPPSQ